MNIVFWGEEGRSGTTAHMLAVEAMLEVRYPQLNADSVFRNGEEETYCVWDCGTGLSVKKRRMLRQADLVVVNLKQERASIEQFFNEHFHLMKNVMYLLDGSDCEIGMEPNYLERVYRVEPDQVAVIPFNNEYYQALSLGKSASFIKRENRKPRNPLNEEFIDVLRGVTDTMVRRVYEYQEQLRLEEEERNRPKRRRRRI